MTSNWGRIRGRKLRALVPSWRQATANGDALSVLFDRGVLRLDRAERALSRVLSLSFEVPYRVAAGAASVEYRADVRIAVAKSEGACVALLLHMAGAAAAFDWPFGAAADAAPEVKTLAARVPLTAAGADRRATPAFACTLLACAARRSRDDFVLFNLDSIDIGAVAA